MSGQSRGGRTVRRAQLERTLEHVTEAHSDAMARSMTAFYEKKVMPLAADLGALRVSRLAHGKRIDKAARERLELLQRVDGLESLAVVRLDRWVRLKTGWLVALLARR